MTAKAQPQPIGEFLPIKQLNPSPTNPRKRFPEGPQAELAESIKTQGVIEPLIVRKNGKGYEIVCGERRYRAAKDAGLESLPCIVRGLTDEQVLDIQIHENLHRQDVHPIDEAIGYKVIHDTLKCSIPELAARLGKDARFVHQRLRLNDLLPEFRKAVENDWLSISVAYLIARYNEDKQKVILREVTRYSKGKVTTNSHLGRDSIERIIQNHVECELADAPFDLKDDRLRKDGLKCVDCTLRAGANPTLFEPVKAKDDRCLDATCFSNKMTAFVTIGRDDLTKAGKKKFGEDYKAAIVGYDHYDNRKSHKDQIGKNDYKKFDDWDRDRKAKCTGKEKAVYIDYHGEPATIEICRDKSCPSHWKKTKAASSGAGGSVDREERKEEIFDAKVREAVRQRVLIEAAPKFALQFVLNSDDEHFYFDLIERAWNRFIDTDQIEHRLVRPYLASIKKKAPSGIYSTDARLKWLTENLSPDEAAAVLFLAVKGPQGSMLYGDRYTSQTEIMTIAARYGINYNLYDAEERLNFCKNKKQRVGLEEYYAKVKAGETADIPRFWKADYVTDESVPVVDDDDIYFDEDDDDLENSGEIDGDE